MTDEQQDQKAGVDQGALDAASVDPGEAGVTPEQLAEAQGGDGSDSAEAEKADEESGDK